VFDTVQSEACLVESVPRFPTVSEDSTKIASSLYVPFDEVQSLSSFDDTSRMLPDTCFRVKKDALRNMTDKM
jgi:hypothetical protein